MKKKANALNNMSSRAVVYLFCQILSQGLGFLLAPIYTRLLSTEDYGIASIFVTTVSILSIAIGLQTHGSLNNARLDFSKEEQWSYNSSVLTISFLSFLFFFCLSFVFKEQLSKLLNLSPILVVLLTITAFGSFCIQFLTSYFTSNKRSFVYLLVSTSIAVLIAILSVTMIVSMNTDRYLGKILGYSLVYVVFGILVFISILFKGKTFYSKKYWSFCLPLTIPLVLHAAAGQILAQSDRLMLNSISGSSVAGVYSFCYTLALPLNAVWFALNSTWVPQYYEHMKNKSDALMHKQSCNYLFVYTCLTLGFILVCPEGVKILAPQSYWSGISIVPMVALSCYFTFLYSFSANYEFYHKKTSLISIASASAALFNIVLNIILIPSHGMMGAALATLLSYVLIFTIHEFVVRFVIKGYNYTIAFYMKGLVPVLAVTLFTYLLMDFWILRWASAVIVGVVLLVGVVRNKGLF